MGTDETQVLEYLRQYPDTYISGIEVGKRASGRKRFQQDRDWARPVLRRLEVEFLVESNEYGHYRIAGTGDQRGGKKRNIYERCRQAVSSHVLQMNADDDNKPFASLLREAIHSEFTEETSWLTKK
jgi:hypothetical protein